MNIIIRGNTKFIFNKNELYDKIKQNFAVKSFIETSEDLLILALALQYKYKEENIGRAIRDRIMICSNSIT
jgi:hypothetical protein